MPLHKPWLASYPPGVAAQVDVARYDSLAHFLAEGFERFAEKTAYTSFGTSLSYAEMGRLSACFAAFLQSGLKLPKGSRVALMLPNLLAYPVCLFGALRGAYVVVNCNPLYTPRELNYQLKDSGAEVLVVLENFAATVQAAMPGTAVKHVVVVAPGDLLNVLKGCLVNLVSRHVKRLVPPWDIPGAIRLTRALARGQELAFLDVPQCREDLAFLQYTGGTTGLAKAAMLTHGNLLANVAQASAWFEPNLKEGGEVVLTALPLYHVFALTANCLYIFGLGANSVLVANPRDLPGLVKVLAQYRFTAITGVNTLFNALMAHPEFEALDFSALRLTLGGGMAVQRNVAESWQEVTGCPIVEAYGLTEASPAVTMNPGDNLAFNGSIGLPIPSTEVVIRNDEGHDLPPGETGEICVRGPQVMSAYWNMPEETANSFWSDGYLRTGDIGIMDVRGFIRLVDRKKDVIIVSGFNVYPNEVEEVAAMYPGVQEAAAVGLPDVRCGELVKLFVVRRDAQLSGEVLVAHCRANLAPYKVPHQVEFVDSLPKNAIGKILRRALKPSA